jgi:RHS repeat-associated protein
MGFRRKNKVSDRPKAYLARVHLVGTTERITDAAAAIAHRAVYTAFGEPVFPSPSQGEGQGEGTIPTRYGYVGAWGYQGNPLSAGWSLEGPGGLCDPAGPEAHCDPVALLGWLHVGERYYDPASGRFMQRDPIGTNGGLNVYAYVENLPTIGIDPDGLNRWLVQEQGLSLHHEGIILQITDTRWARIDFGSYSWGNGNNNVEIKFSSNPCSLLRHRDKIIRKRETTVDHDRKTIRKMVRKYGSKSYIFPFRICWTVAEKLFDDTPPTLPGRR